MCLKGSGEMDSAALTNMSLSIMHRNVHHSCDIASLFLLVIIDTNQCFISDFRDRYSLNPYLLNSVLLVLSCVECLFSLHIYTSKCMGSFLPLLTSKISQTVFSGPLFCRQGSLFGPYFIKLGPACKVPLSFRHSGILH